MFDLLHSFSQSDGFCELICFSFELCMDYRIQERSVRRNTNMETSLLEILNKVSGAREAGYIPSVASRQP